MARNFQQTDSAAVDGSIAACTSLAASSSIDNRQVSQSGTPGTSTPSVTQTDKFIIQRLIHWESTTGEPGLTNWSAGNWTIPLNVTALNTSLTWDSVYICRVNSSGVSQGTVGSATGLGISLGTTGVNTATVSGSSQTASSTDRVYVVLGIANVGANNSFSYKPDQVITSPLPVDFGPGLQIGVKPSGATSLVTKFTKITTPGVGCCCGGGCRCDSFSLPSTIHVTIQRTQNPPFGHCDCGNLTITCTKGASGCSYSGSEPHSCGGAGRFTVVVAFTSTGGVGINLIDDGCGAYCNLTCPLILTSRQCHPLNVVYQWNAPPDYICGNNCHAYSPMTLVITQ